MSDLDMNFSKLRETAKDGGAWHATVHGLQRIGHDLATEQQQLDPKCLHLIFSLNHKGLS